jgi:hypothetical protein
MKNKSMIAKTFQPIFVLGIALAWAVPSYATTSRVGSAQDLGFGPQLGQPMGVTAKYWLDSTLAVDGFMGYHFNSNFDTHVDFLWHSFSSFNVASGRLPFYLGAGARILGGNDSQLGVRLPLGVSYLFPSQPLEAYAEVAPVIKVAPGIGIDIDGAVGVRLYINYIK